MAAGKLVGVRLPPLTYRRLQALKRDLHVDGDAAAIRRIIEEFPTAWRPRDMPVFSAPLRSPPTRHRKPLAEEHDAVLQAPRRTRKQTRGRSRGSPGGRGRDR